MTGAWIQGLILQASMILVLGAQNIFVLNSGLRKNNHLWVALISTICDTLLIMLGVLGASTLFLSVPLLKIALGILGVCFLFYYGFGKLKEARSNPQSLAAGDNQSQSLRQTILATLGFSLLNPHVYLDTIVLIGGFSTQFSVLQERIAFGLGASTFSLIWFFGLSISASQASACLNRPNTMRWIAVTSGVILIYLSLKLGLDVSHWIVAY